MEDVIVLLEREEISDLIGNEITDKQWEDVKQRIMRDKHVWQIIDETIAQIVEELI